MACCTGRSGVAMRLLRCKQLSASPRPTGAHAQGRAQTPLRQDVVHMVCPAVSGRRCVRPDQSSATVRCHYLTDGTVNFAFTMRRAEYFIPAGVLLKCFLEVGRSGVKGGAVRGGVTLGGAVDRCW